MDIRRQLILKIGKDNRQSRLGIPLDQTCSMTNRRMVVETTPQARQHFMRNGILHLGRNTGHRYEDLIVPIKPHDRCRSHRIVYNGTRIGHQCLIACKFIHRKTFTGKPFLIHLLHFLIAMQGAPVKFAKGLFCNIVFGRAQTARHQNNRYPRKSIENRFFYLVLSIPDHRNFGQFPPHKVQLAGNPTRIGIGNLPYKQLVSYGYNFYIHSYLFTIPPGRTEEGLSNRNLYPCTCNIP